MPNTFFEAHKNENGVNGDGKSPSKMISHTAYHKNRNRYQQEVDADDVVICVILFFCGKCMEQKIVMLCKKFFAVSRVNPFSHYCKKITRRDDFFYALLSPKKLHNVTFIFFTRGYCKKNTRRDKFFYTRFPQKKIT